MRAPPFFMPTITGQAIDFLLQRELVTLDTSGDVPVLKHHVAGEEIRRALVGEFGEDWEVQDFIRRLNTGQLSPNEQLARSPAVRMAVPSLPEGVYKADFEYLASRQVRPLKPEMVLAWFEALTPGLEADLLRVYDVDGIKYAVQAAMPKLSDKGQLPGFYVFKKNVQSGQLEVALLLIRREQYYRIAKEVLVDKRPAVLNEIPAEDFYPFVPIKKQPPHYGIAYRELQGHIPFMMAADGEPFPLYVEGPTYVKIFGEPSVVGEAWPFKPLLPAAFKAFTREWFEAIPFEHPSAVLVKYADGSWQKLVVFVSNILANISTFFSQDNAGRLVLLAFPDGGGIGWGAALKAEIYHALNTGKKIESPLVEFYLRKMTAIAVNELQTYMPTCTMFNAERAEYSMYDPQNPDNSIIYSLPSTAPAYLAPADVKLGTQYWFEAHRLSTPGLVFIGTQKFLFFINDDNKSILLVTHIADEPELRLGLVTTKDLPPLVFGRFRQALLQTLGSPDRVVKDVQLIDNYEQPRSRSQKTLHKMLLMPDPTDGSGHRQAAIPLELAEFSPQGAQIAKIGSFAVEDQTIVHKGGGRQKVVYHAVSQPQKERFLSELWFHGIAHNHPAMFRMHDVRGTWPSFVLMNVNSSDDILSYVTINEYGQISWTSLLCTSAKYENVALRRDLREALAQGRDIDNPALLARLLMVENIYEVEKILGTKKTPYGTNSFQIRGNCLVNDVHASGIDARYVYSLYEPPHESSHPAYSAAWFDEFPENHAAVFWLQDGSDAWHKCILLVPAPEARFYSFVTKDATGQTVLFLQPCEDDLTEAARLAMMDALHTSDKKVYSTKLTFAPGEKYYDLEQLRDGIGVVAGESSDVQLRVQGNAVRYQRGPGSDIASHYTFTIPHQVVEVPTAREHKVFTPAWFKALRIEEPGVFFTRDEIKVVWMPAPAGQGFALLLEHRGRLYAGLAKGPNPEDQQYFDCLTKVFSESQTGNRLARNLSVELTNDADAPSSVLAAVIKLWNPPIPGAAWGGYKISFYDLGPAATNIDGYGTLKKMGDKLVVQPLPGKSAMIYEFPQTPKQLPLTADGAEQKVVKPLSREWLQSLNVKNVAVFEYVDQEGVWQKAQLLHGDGLDDDFPVLAFVTTEGPAGHASFFLSPPESGEGVQSLYQEVVLALAGRKKISDPAFGKLLHVFLRSWDVEDLRAQRHPGFGTQSQHTLAVEDDHIVSTIQSPEFQGNPKVVFKPVQKIPKTFPLKPQNALTEEWFHALPVSYPGVFFGNDNKLVLLDADVPEDLGMLFTSGFDNRVMLGLADRTEHTEDRAVFDAFKEVCRLALKQARVSLVSQLRTSGGPIVEIDFDDPANPDNRRTMPFHAVPLSAAVMDFGKKGAFRMKNGTLFPVRKGQQSVIFRPMTAATTAAFVGDEILFSPSLEGRGLGEGEEAELNNEPAQVVPDPVATALAELAQMNEARTGISRLALDLSQWGRKPFGISRPDSPFALQLGVSFEPRNYDKGYTRGAFRRHSRRELREATYTLYVQWGKNSSTVAYRVAGENPNFVLELADQKFPYHGKVFLRFNPQAREGTEDAWFEVERGSALHQFLDFSVGGPKLFVDRDDGGIIVRAEWDADGALLQQIWEIWGELLPGATKEGVAVATDGAWEFRVPYQAAQENLVAAKLSLTSAIYDASVKQKREPMWKRPVEPVETKPKEPPKVAPASPQFSFATQFVKLALDPSRDPQLKSPHVVAEVEVKKAADGHCISHTLKNLTIRGQAFNAKTMRVATTHGEFKLAVPLGPSPRRLTLIREVTMPEAGWETITLELLVSEAGVAQMIGVEETFVTVKDKTTELSVTTQIALSPEVPVDDSLKLTAVCIEDPLQDQLFVKLLLEGRFGQRRMLVVTGVPSVTFDLGPLYGPITYNLTWQKNALAASRAVMDVAFFKERDRAGKLQIQCLADNGALLKVDVEEVEEGWQERLFVSTNQVPSLTRWLGVVGANFSFDPDFHTHVEVVEVGSDIHLHPIRSLGNFKPLTWLSLDHGALEALRDALYPKPIAALHGELIDDPTAVAIISPVPKAISLPDSHLLRFAGHESFVPTEDTVTMIADASFRFYDGGEWKLGMSFAEGSLYWYDVQGWQSGTRLRIPVIWSPHRFTNPWVLDENRSLRIYDEGESPDSARIVADNHVVMEDRGGEWLVTYFEARASSQADGTVTIKRWELVASPDPESPLFVHLYNHLGEDRSFVAKQARIARGQSQEKMQTWIGRVLADRGKKVPSHEFGEQKIQPTEGRLVTLKYRATQSGNIQVAQLEGVQYVAQGLGQKPALVFPGPLTLTIHPSFDSPDVLETYSLVAVEPPRNADGQIYLLELKDKEVTGRFFVWHPLTGTLILREQLGDILSREAFAAIIKGQNLPFTPADRQRSFTPRPRTHDPQALMEVDERIPVLPVTQRGYAYPQHIERVTVDELVQKLLARLEETVFYPEEESLFAQVLNGRNREVMTFTSVNGAILQVPMHLTQGNYVAASQANPHTGLSGVRLLVPNREKAGSFYDLPCFVHPRRGTGRRPILRLLVGSEQRLFTFIQWSQAQTVGREAFLFHAAATDKHRTAPANVIKELGALLEYNGLEKGAPPITPVDFEFGKNIALPDGRELELKVLHHPGRHPPYSLSGYEIIRPEGQDATAVLVRYHEPRKKAAQSMMLYRAAGGGATYFLRANSGKFLRMVISDKGIPLFYERPPGVQHYQQAVEHEFPMVRIRGGHYVSEATSVAKRIRDTEDKNTFEIRAALGRGQGATRMHVDLEGGSRAFVKFKVRQKRDGTIVVSEAFIKQEGKGNPWEDAEVEVTTAENGRVRIFLRSTASREGNYRDYAWLEFAGAGDLLGTEFKVFQSHYNMTNSPAAQLLPSEPGFVNMMSGAAMTPADATVHTLYAFAAEWRDPLAEVHAALQEKFGDEDADARQLSAHLTATAANGALGFAEGENLVDILDRSATRLPFLEDRIVELLVLLRRWQEANGLREEAARHVKNQAWRLAQAGLVRAHVFYEDLGILSEELRTLSLLACVQMARGQYFEASELLKTLALSAQESGDEASTFSHGVLFLQARLKWAREHALLDPSAQHDLRHQADLLAGMAGGELTRMLQRELLSYTPGIAIPPPPHNKSLPSPLMGEGKGEGADVLLQLGFPMNALADLARAEAEQNARPVLDELALDRLRWLKARAAVMAFANNVLREPSHFFSLTAVVDGLVVRGESNLAEKNYDLCQLDFLTALVMAYESHDPAMAAKIRSKLSAFYGSHGAMMVELMEKRRAKRDLLDAGMAKEARAITEDGEIAGLLATAVAEMPADEKEAYVQKAKRFGGSALKARAAKNFGSELLCLLAAGHAYLEGGFFAEWLQMEHTITDRLKEQGFYAASHHWNTSLKNVDPLHQPEFVPEAPGEPEPVVDKPVPTVTKQKFALGAESLSPWAKECLYGLIRMHAEGQNYGGASELAFPDASFTSSRGGKVSLTLQLGYYFESGKDDIPKTLGAVPEKELKWVMDQLMRRAGELGADLLDVMARRTWVAEEVHGILRVLGFWLPKHLEFLREEGWDEEKIKTQIFNFLDGAETPDAICAALSVHLQQAHQVVRNWKGAQTVWGVAERRKKQGIPEPTFKWQGGRRRGSSSKTKPMDVPAEVDVGDGPPDSGDLGDIKASSSIGIGGRATEISGNVFGGGRELFDGSAALKLEPWEEPVVVAEPVLRPHLQLVEPPSELDQDAADHSTLDSGADAELDHSATQHPALFGQVSAISRTGLHHPLFRIVR